jgi:HAD superfamily hydrolase (TIGR01549 family)
MSLSQKKSRFKYVLFDLGNTLFYFRGTYRTILLEGYQAVASTLSQMGIVHKEEIFLKRFLEEMDQYSREREQTCVEQGSLVILKRTLAEFTSEKIADSDLRKAIDALYSLSEKYWEIEEDAIPCLESLKAEGYHLGIISNAADSQDVNQLLQKGKIAPYFEQVIISAEFGLRKPHPKIFHKALSFWKAQPEEAVMIGDTLNADIIGAQNVNMSAVWITRRTDPPGYRGHFASIEPNADITTLAELPGLLRRWQ